MVEAVHISKNYGKKAILSDINFQADCGECIAVVGKNGCGKSTLLQILAGTIKPDCGEIRYFGKSRKEIKEAVGKYCGYVPQENPLLEELSVKDNLRLWGGGKGQKYEELIRQFQLQELLHTPVKKLSGGMKRRLAIASAMLESPAVLLMDEPTTALDLYYKDSIHEIIKAHLNTNGIVIMATHDEGEIEDSTRCFYINKGVMSEVKDVSAHQRVSWLRERLAAAEL